MSKKKKFCSHGQPKWRRCPLCSPHITDDLKVGRLENLPEETTKTLNDMEVVAFKMIVGEKSN